MVRFPHILLPAALLVVLLSCTRAPAQYPEWDPPPACIFAMPYSGHDVEPGNTGRITEILKGVFDDAGWDLEHVNLPYPRALEQVRSGQAQLSLSLGSRVKGVVYGKSVLGVYDLAVTSMATDPYKNPGDLKDQPVAMLFGYHPQRLVGVKFIERPAYALTSAIRMLERGQVRFVLDEASQMRQAILDAQLPLGHFVITPIERLYVVPIFTDSPKGKKLRDLYDRKFRRMMGNGAMERLLRESGLHGVEIKRILKANGR